VRRKLSCLREISQGIEMDKECCLHRGREYSSAFNYHTKAYPPAFDGNRPAGVRIRRPAVLH
jgi:hypothetical protein